MTRPRCVALALTGLIASIVGGTASAHAASFPFQPITIQRINLPSNVPTARWPAFAHDGKHLLFWSANELWITDLHGRGVRCLSCGLANDPNPSGSVALADLATPFPDGKRVLMEEDAQVASSGLVVLECAPSVADCRTRQLVPVDYSGAEPSVIAPGGAVSSPQIGLAHVAAHAQLSPDGNYVGFSQARSDSIEAMVVGRLERNGNGYVVTDPRVINPPAPTSSSDPNVEHWSDSSSLTEFKTFTNGGADATYVQTGGPQIGVNVWSVNLATGSRTRLVAAPDWNEDNGVAPNGKLLSVFSDRTMHYVDWIGGLVPVRDFIDAPSSTESAGPTGGFSECMGPMWLLPSSGDQGGTLAGEPIVDYRYPGVHVVDTLAESSQWSPDSTMIALNTIDDPTGQAAPFLLVAHLTALKATHPLPVVSSQPGSWAPPPSQYHGTIGHNGTVTLHGPGGGTVTVDYGGMPGALSGQWSETYANYSDDGRDLVNGTVKISGAVEDSVSYSQHLTMNGANTGSDNTDLTFTNQGISGHATSTYDGHTITGPPPYASGDNGSGGPSTACPNVLPKEPALRVRAVRIRRGVYKVKVTVSIADVGASEASTDTEPVYRAALRLGRKTTYTNRQGIATVRVRKDRHLKVAAGDTLKPTSAHL